MSIAHVCRRHLLNCYSVIKMRYNFFLGWSSFQDISQELGKECCWYPWYDLPLHSIYQHISQIEFSVAQNLHICSVSFQQLQLYPKLLPVVGHIYLLNTFFSLRSKHNLVETWNICCIFLWNSLGAKHNPNCSLKKDCVPMGCWPCLKICSVFPTEPARSPLIYQA